MPVTKKFALSELNATPQKAAKAVDPLGDVIDWLEFADLGEELADTEETAATSSGAPGGQTTRELFGDSPTFPARDLPAPNGGADVPPVFSGRQQPAGGQPRSLVSYCGIGDAEDAQVLPRVDPDEEEWDARQKQTGAAGRLVVYDESESPKADFLLRGGGGRRIIVTAVTDGRKAAIAGVKAGDILVSIDGKKDFKDKSADQVHASLKGPVMLVFMGFVGKLQAEVRLNYKQKVCGLSSQHEVIFGHSEAPVRVVDEVIFQPASATLFLATHPPEAHTRPWSQGRRANAVLTGDDGDVCEEDLGVGEERPGNISRKDVDGTAAGGDSLSAVYELRNHEARSIVNRALNRARTASPVAPRYLSLDKPQGDHAQAPRSVTPPLLPFSSGQLDGRMAIRCT